MGCLGHRCVAFAPRKKRSMRPIWLLLIATGLAGLESRILASKPGDGRRTGTGRRGHCYCRRLLPCSAPAPAARSGFRPLSKSAPASPEAIEFFERHVRPVLANHCGACHGAKKQEAGLRLDSRAAVVKGSDEGPVVVAGDPAASKLIAAINYQDEDLQMPPDGKLPAEAIAALSRVDQTGTSLAGRGRAGRVGSRWLAAALGVSALGRRARAGGAACRLGARGRSIVCFGPTGSGRFRALAAGRPAHLAARA